MLVLVLVPLPLPLPVLVLALMLMRVLVLEDKLRDPQIRHRHSHQVSKVSHATYGLIIESRNVLMMPSEFNASADHSYAEGIGGKAQHSM